jgi:hypothetical protein
MEAAHHGELILVVIPTPFVGEVIGKIAQELTETQVSGFAFTCVCLSDVFEFQLTMQLLTTADSL